MRVLLETNVLVSAFTARGLCADLLREILARHTLVTGEVVLAEFRRILSGKFRAPRAVVEAAVAAASAGEVVPRPRRRLALRSRDPSDDLVLASAVAGKADLLVTGDRDFLCPAGRAPLPILSPREAWGRVRRG